MTQIIKKNESAIKGRLIAPVQSTGRMGKSTVQQMIWEWFAFAGVPSAAIDADDEHKTFSQWYPADVTFAPFRRQEDLLPMLDACGVAPAELIDFPAQATSEILAGFNQFSGLDILAQKGIRLTVLIFASDDRAAMSSAAEALNYLGNDVDYALVCNAARFASEIFKHSKLAKMFSDAPVIELPPITQATMNQVDKAGKEAGRPLTLREASKSASIGSRMELENFISRCFVQFEEAIRVLLPEESLVQNRVQRSKLRASPKRINAFEL